MLFSGQIYYYKFCNIKEDSSHLYCYNGKGIIDGENDRGEVQKGDGFFLPQGAKVKCKMQIKEGEELEVVVCIPLIR